MVRTVSPANSKVTGPAGCLEAVTISPISLVLGGKEIMREETDSGGESLWSELGEYG